MRELGAAVRQPSDTWERSDPYERYMGRWSRRVAPLFLTWLRVPPHRRWLDVGCGTGALTAAILDQCSPSFVAGVEPSTGFLERANESLEGRAVLRQGSATAILLNDASVDVVVSGLVLNFVPDARAALAEMARVTDKGGAIAAYVWDYAGKMELLRYFWDTAAELDPHAASAHEATRFPVCRPGALRQLFADAGLKDIETMGIDIATPFASFEDYWEPFFGGQGPAPAYLMMLDEDARSRLRDRIRARLPILANGSIQLKARAWTIRATVTK
jgi:ubiquinone/menaquinone biosynthesis C-methylase UbiE